VGLNVRVPAAGPFLFPTVLGRDYLRLDDVTGLWAKGLEAIPAASFGIKTAGLRLPFGGGEEALDQAVAIVSEWVNSLAGTSVGRSNG
jgi:hypothetical protein